MEVVDACAADTNIVDYFREAVVEGETGKVIVKAVGESLTLCFRLIEHVGKRGLIWSGHPFLQLLPLAQDVSYPRHSSRGPLWSDAFVARFARFAPRS